MTLKEFIATISTFEYFSYTHIMEIPESSLEFAKALNNEQWNTIYQERTAIALCCKIGSDINILFSSDCYKSIIVPQKSILGMGSLVMDLNEVSKIIISPPRGQSGEIQFCDMPTEFGHIEIIPTSIKKEDIRAEKKTANNKKIESTEVEYEFVINLRGVHSAHVSVDYKQGKFFFHLYEYLIQHHGKYYLSSDLHSLTDAEFILRVDLSKKNIDNASFISDDLFYYNTRDTYTSYTDCRCGLISISRGEIISGDRYSTINHFIGEQYFVVSLYNDNNSRLDIKVGLVDINGVELLPPIYSDIRVIEQGNKLYKIWVKGEKNSEKWLIYEPSLKCLRDVRVEDYS